MSFAAVKQSLSENPKRWLVTGAAGFIASHLSEFLLRHNQEVVAIDNFATGHRHNLSLLQDSLTEAQKQNFRFVELDVSTPGAIDAHVQGVDYILHQAALGSVPRSIEEPLASNEANVTGFLAVLEAARRASVKRVVYASSSSVYGDDPQLPKVESVLGNQLSPYAVTKRVNELYAWVFEDCYGLECIGLRYFNVFGPRQDPAGAYAAVIPRWIDALTRGEQCVIYGDGETSRDFCYVDNVVQANVLAALASGEGVTKRYYNIALGGRTTLNELFYAIRDQLLVVRPELKTAQPELLKPHYEEFRAGDIRHSLADITAAQELLGFEPEVSAEAGIAQTVAWFNNRRQE